MAGIPTVCRPGSLRIGNIPVDPPLILAPMAGVTDSIYRGIMARHGAGLVTTEMVSVQGIVRNQRTTWELCGLDDPPDVPLAVQLFGHDPTAFAEAARRVEAGGASIVDINAGCPVKKVVKQGAGAGLLKTPEHLLRIVEEVRRAVRIPLTVKLRLGWDSSSLNVLELARCIESAGADAVTIHGRTAVQQYAGRADWSWIGRVKAALGIPVIGNGDVTSPSLADAMLAETSCDGVMIGRASRGNPWLFSAVAAAWGRGESGVCLRRLGRFPPDGPGTRRGFPPGETPCPGALPEASHVVLQGMPRRHPFAGPPCGDGQS